VPPRIKFVGRARLAPGAGAGDESVWRQYQLRRSAADGEIIVLDAGTGIRALGLALEKGAGTRNDQADSSH